MLATVSIISSNSNFLEFKLVDILSLIISIGVAVTIFVATNIYNSAKKKVELCNALLKMLHDKFQQLEINDIEENFDPIWKNALSIKKSLDMSRTNLKKNKKYKKILKQMKDFFDEADEFFDYFSNNFIKNSKNLSNVCGEIICKKDKLIFLINEMIFKFC